MTRAFAGIMLLLFTAGAHATLASMHFEPPVCDPLHSVEAIIYGTEGCIIGPTTHTVTREGSTLRIQLIYTSSVCLSVPSSWRYVAPLGTLPAGVYNVVVTATIGGRTSTTNPQTLIVREIGSVRFDRAAVPISGGSIGVIDYGLCPNPYLGQCASAISFDGGRFGWIDRQHVDVPPHAAGTVDVTVLMEDNTRETIKAAITYYDPAAPPDLALFEPILFPIAYNGDGAFGSRWATENALNPAKGLFRSSVDLDVSRPEGVLLWALRGTADEADAQSRIRETTQDDMGVEVRVVHDHDFSRPRGDYFTGRGLRIVDIPKRADARYTLRVYSLGDPGGMSVDVKRIALSKTDTDGLWFTAIDVTDLIARKTSPASLDLRSSVSYDVPYWAMVSITDNATQQVTIVSPQ